MQFSEQLFIFRQLCMRMGVKRPRRKAVRAVTAATISTTNHFANRRRVIAGWELWD